MASSSAKHHRPSRLLTPEENETLFLAIPKGCQSLSTAVVQLLVSDPPNHERWRKFGCGVVCFIKDKNNRSFYFRMYDLKNEELVWEQELYYEMQYQVRAAADFSPIFHTFEVDTCMAAFNFADEAEASDFYDKVSQKIEMLRRQSSSLAAEPLMGQHKTRESASSNLRASGAGIGLEIQQAMLPNQMRFDPLMSVQGVLAHSRVSGPIPNVDIRGIRYGKNDTTPKKSEGRKKRKTRLTAGDVSAPLKESFQHIQHTGWDPDKGMVTVRPDLLINGNRRMPAQPISSQPTRPELARLLRPSPLPPLRRAPSPVGVPLIAGHSRDVSPQIAPKNTKFVRDGSPSNSETAQVSKLGLDQKKNNHSSDNLLPPRPSAWTVVPEIVVSAELRFSVPPPPPPPPPLVPSDGLTSDEGDSLHEEASSGKKAPNANRSALLVAIQQGKKLRPVGKKDEGVSAGATKAQLMVSIAETGQRGLTKAQSPQTERSNSPSLGGMAAAMEKALAMRRSAVYFEEDSSSEDDWDC